MRFGAVQASGRLYAPILMELRASPRRKSEVSAIIQSGFLWLCRFPYSRMNALKIDSFSGGVSRDKHLHRRIVRERLLSLSAFLAPQAAILISFRRDIEGWATS